MLTQTQKHLVNLLSRRKFDKSEKKAKFLLGLALFLALSLFTVAACHPSEPPPPSGQGAKQNDDQETPGDSTLPEAKCIEAKPWDGNRPAFRDASQEWGLPELNVTGTRISAVDFDGDGWPDLVVRAVGAGIDEPSAENGRRFWLLRNKEGQGFEDVTHSSGITQRRRPGNQLLGRAGEVVAFADVNNDGHLDAWLGLDTDNPGLVAGEHAELLLNDGNGKFSLAPKGPHCLSGFASRPGGAAFVDVNLDGNIDLWVTQNRSSCEKGCEAAQDRLFLGNGSGGFVDASLETGLDKRQGLPYSNAWSALACDLNNDGVPELLAASYGRAPNHLWRGELSNSEQGVRFANRSVSSGYAYDDNQSWSDNQFARCYCQQDRSAEGCAEVPAPAVQCPVPAPWNHFSDRQPPRLGGNSGTTVCADLNNDGHLDLLTTEIRHWWAGSGSDASEILLNTGDYEVTFERPGREAVGLTVPHSNASWDEGHMTAAVFDFDNDGWPDIYIGGSDYPDNRGLLYRQASPLSFELIEAALGIDHPRSHGIAVADFNRDGRLDVVVGHSSMRCAQTPGDSAPCLESKSIRLFQNQLADSGNWLQLKLEGAPGTNRAAIGARIEVEFESDSSGGLESTRQTKIVDGGHGHFGIQHDLVQHFGLGSACKAKVRVSWPNRELNTETWELPAGHRFLIREGQEPKAM